MAEDRKLIYTVEVNANKAEETVKSLKEEVSGLRKSIGEIRNEKISLDGTGLKQEVGEIRKELDGMKNSISEISKGNLKITDGNLAKEASESAKGIEGIQVATKGANAALQTYAEKLRITEKAIDNLSQMMKNGLSTKIEVNGIEYTMSRLRALESYYKDMKKGLKAGSLESQEKEYFGRLAEAQKNYDKLVESSNRQREQGIKLSQSAWKQQIADIEAAKKALAEFGNEADFSKKPLLTEKSWTDYLKGIDNDGSQERRIRGNVKEIQEGIIARSKAIAQNQKKAADEAERAAKAAQKEAEALAKAEAEAKARTAHAEDKRAFEEQQKAMREQAEARRQELADIEAKEKATAGYIAQLQKMNYELRMAKEMGSPMSPLQYAKNYPKAKELENKIHDNGHYQYNAYQQTPQEYKAARDLEKAQADLVAKTAQYEALIRKVNVDLEKGKTLVKDEYDGRVKALTDLEKEISLLREKYHLEAKLPSNPLKDDERFNTFENYAKSMGDINAKSYVAPLVSYQQELRRLQNATENLYSTYLKDPSPKNLANFAATRNALVATRKEYAAYQKRIEETGTSIDSLGRKLKSHASWIFSGFLVGSAAMIPAGIITQITQLDQQMANIRQVIPQIEANPNEAGTAKFTNEQKQMNQAMTDFIGIAAKYGTSTQEVMDAARSIGRMYGQGDNGLKNTEIFTAQAAKMSVADAFPMLNAVKGLEAAMSQWNLQTNDSTKLMRNSQYIIDVWTRTAHSGAASAQDIGEAIENAGTAAAQAGVSFDFFNALVETGVRATARSGNEIGQSIKSMMVSMQSDKAEKALKQWGISLKEVGEDGKEHMRSMEDVIMDVSLLVSTTTTDTQKLISVLSGGRYQYSKVSAILKNYKELLRMQGLLNDGNTKGFSDQQVAVQMDTISRKFQKIKEDMTQSVAAIGQGGGLNEIKYLLNTIDNVIVGINKLNESFADGQNHIKKYIDVIMGLGTAYLVLRRAVGAYERAVGAYRASEFAQREGGSGFTVWDNYRKAQQARGAAYGSGKAATNQAIINATGNGEAASKAADTAAETANSAATADNTAKKAANASATTAASGATNNEAASKTRETAAENANASATARDTATKAGNAAASRSAAAAETVEAAAARSAAGANTANAVSERAAGVAAATLGARARVAAAGVAAFSAAQRVANVALAAFGGPIGLVITAATVLVPLYLSSAEAAGEAANAEKELKDAMDQRIASAQEEAELADRQGQAAEKLAKQYNALEDKIKSGTLTTEEATKAKQHQGEIEQTVSEILGRSAVQFDENGRMNIQTIKAVAAANRGKSTEQLKQDAQQMRSEARKIRAEASATRESVKNARTRIDNMKKEAQSCKQVATAYGALWSLIAGFKAAVGNFKIKEAAELEDLANSYGDKAGDKSFLGWFGFARDSRIDGIGGPDAARAEAARLREEGLEDNENAVHMISEHGGSQHDAESIIDGAAAAIGDYTATLEDVNDDREGEAANLEKMAGDSDAAAALITGDDETDGIATSHDNGYQDPNNYTNSRTPKGKTPHTPKDNKEIYEYDTETAQASFNLGHYLSEEGVDTATMLALVKIANGLSGIKKEDLEGLTDPFQTGGENPMRSAFLLGQKYYDRKQPGMTAIDVLAALYPNADIRGQLDAYTTHLTKGDKGTAFAGYDFSTRAPKNGDDFDDENNHKVSSGYVANSHDYENGGYTSPELRKIADETAAIISEHLGGAQVNSDFLYGQMMAEGGYGAQQQQYHNYAGIGPWHQYASDEDFEKAYAYEYYADGVDGKRARALRAPTATEFVNLIDLDDNGNIASDGWNHDANQDDYARNIDTYANEGNRKAAAPVNTTGDIDATPTGFLGANYDIKWDDSDALDPEFLTKLAMFHEHFLRAAQILAGSDKDFEVTSTTGGSHDDPNHAAGKAADLVSNLFYDADFRGKMTEWAEAHGLRVYDEYNRANWTDKTTGDNYHVSDAGGAAADFSQTAKAASADFSAAGISVKGAGHQIVDAWKGTQKGLYSWNKSGIELKRQFDQMAKTLHETTQAVIEFGQKIRGNLDPQQHADAFKDARVQVAQTTQNLDFWKAAKTKTNNDLWATLHDGKHNDVLAAIGDTDFGKLSDESQNELASKAQNSKDLQQAVKNNQMAKAGYREAFSSSLKARENYADTVGYMTQSDYMKTQLSEVDNYYNEKTMDNSMPQYKANEEAAKAKKEILDSYKKKLNENLVAAMKQTDEDLVTMGNDRITHQKRADELQSQYDAQDAKVKELQTKGNPAEAQELDNALQKREGINKQLKIEQDTLQLINNSIEQTKNLGNVTMRNTITELHNVATETKKCNDVINDSARQLQTTVTNGFHTMFSDVLLEGKSFASSFKNLWKNIGQLALNILMTRHLDPFIGRLFGGHATGGSVDKKATGGILGYASGGQAGGAIHGAGTGTSDSILAYLANKDKFVYLSNGEYVMTEEATKRIGKDKLDQLNYGKYAGGGAISPTPYVPQLSPMATKKAQGLTHENSNKRLEELMIDQTNTIRKMGDNNGNNGGVVVLNTHASSEDVMKALAENPRAVQAILGRQRHYGFR